MNWIQKNASTILTIFGAGGMLATVILAVKATPKAERQLKDAEEKKGRKLTVVETVRTCGKAYIPTAAVGAGSLACIFSANALSRRQQASLAGAYLALEGAYKGYREKAKEILGPGTDGMIEDALEESHRDEEDNNPPWDELQTFYIDLALTEKPCFFERTMYDVARMEYEINRLLVLRGWATVNDMLAFLHLEKVPDGDRYGWDQDDGETVWGYHWIDFCHNHYTTDDGLLVCDIELPFEPHLIRE